MNNKHTHVSYLTQCPGPYREKMHELVAKQNEFNYDVIYCVRVEPDREWKIEYGNYEKHFLAETASTVRHNDPSIWKLLNKIKPSVLIITAFKPTMLYGVLWCVLNGSKVIVYNDGTYLAEQRLSFPQKLVRKLVNMVTSAFMAPGNGTVDLYRSYGVSDAKIFKSCLCVDNSQLQYNKPDEREYHVMFSGQIIERKAPFFFGDVVIALNKLHPNLKVLIVGDGELRPALLSKLDANDVDYNYTGYLNQKSLFEHYAKAKVFLFTTLEDVWGVVGNEACGSGTPVITSRDAGVADDLVIHGKNGYILEHNVDLWVNHTLNLLTNSVLLNEFSENAIEMVKPYNHQQASSGLIEAVRYSLADNKKELKSNISAV